MNGVGWGGRPPDRLTLGAWSSPRTSIRCLRLMMFVSDARRVLEELHGPEILNRAVAENALDDFVKTDVTAIFAAVYGGENAVRRIASANVQIVAEMMAENRESAIVQLAGARRICQLLADADAMLYSPLSPPSASANGAAGTAAARLYDDIDTFRAVELVTSMLRRFDVDRYLSLYLHTCRFISFVAAEGEYACVCAESVRHCHHH